MGPKKSPYQALRDSLPQTSIVFPVSYIDRAKYLFWKAYTPFHPFFRDVCIKLGIVSLEKKTERWGARQDFLIGTIAPGETFETVVAHLVGQGYCNHFVAWEDDGEVVSLRYVEDFKTQYHVRIFDDGEVRAHFELTPEHSPFKHYYAVGFEDRRDYFLKVFGNKIVPPGR